MHANNAQALQRALTPFRDASCSDAYEAVSFVHAFGTSGASSEQWNALFVAALSAQLRVQHVLVLLAMALSGATEMNLRQASTMMRHVLFGTDAHPGVIERVCDLYDEWALGDALFERLMRFYIAQSVSEWSLVVEERACYIRGNGREWMIGDRAGAAAVTDVFAKIVVASVVPNVVEQVAQLVSFGGRDRVKLLLQDRLVQLLYSGVVHAKSLLYENMFGANA